MIKLYLFAGVNKPLQNAGISLPEFTSLCIPLMRIIEDHSVEEIVDKDEQGDT